MNVIIIFFVSFFMQYIHKAGIIHRVSTSQYITIYRELTLERRGKNNFILAMFFSL